MKKIINLTLLFILISNLSFAKLFNFGKKSKQKSEKLTIITTLFPQYDFAKQIAGDKAEVTLILKPGSEAHSFDPTPKDMVKISNADLFIYTSKVMEPWVDKVEKSVNKKKVLFVDSSEGIKHFDEEHEEHHEDEDKHHDADMDEHEEEDHGHEHEHGEDPHIWTSPVLAVEMAENILDALIKVDSKNAELYKKNAENYISKLEQLDNKLDNSISKFKRKTIVTGGHFAMSHFAERYDLQYISAYTGFAPNAEPKPKDVAKLREFISENNIKYIFFEELVNPKIAKVLSDETGVELLLLHGAHNVSKQELEEEITYIDIMENNLKNLKTGLDY